MMENPFPRFFAGASTPKGFCSFFGELYDGDRGEAAYLLKGGPGTGKSTLLRRLAEEGARQGDRPTLFLCSSDPDSLDAVRFDRARLCVADATAPHVMEPRLPGVCENLIPLGEGFSISLLRKNAAPVRELFARNAALHARASRYFSAVGELLGDTYALSLGATDIAKARRFGETALRKLLPPLKKSGSRTHRFLSAVTPQGMVYLRETLEVLCDTVLEIEDLWGPASDAVLLSAASEAERLGYEVICCPSPLSPTGKLDHIILPEARLALSVSDRYHRGGLAHRTLHATRFTCARALAEHRARIAFNRKSAARLIETAGEILREANRVHRQLEGYYRQTMDFRVVEPYFVRIAADLAARQTR